MKKSGLLATLICVPALFACTDNSNSNSNSNKSSVDSKAAVTNESLDKSEMSNKVDVNDAAMTSGVDYHSFSNPDEVRVTHLSLDLTANFNTKQLIGTATLSVERSAPGNNQLVLDTRALEISGVSVDGEPVPFDLGETDADLGTPLSISLPENANQVTVNYATSPNASGVQWLTPAQTAGKKHPFLFTQAQAVHARSFIPLQ
ncbi:MAG: aminopeptidase, partial [Alteromonas sp.]|nr:aminopeptidase [Alteromonas sp.]